MSQNKPIRRVAIIGTGVIGASWTSLFLAKGLDVVATDVAPGAETALNLKFTISSPLQMHGVDKAPARRAPELGEHSEEILEQLGFNTNEIDALRTSGTVPKAQGRAA